MNSRSIPPLVAAALVLAAAPVPVIAQDRALAFELGLGVSASPAYEGSDEYTAGPAVDGSVAVLNWWFFNIDKGDGLGFGIGPSFRYLGERTAKDHARLTGIDDVDAALELGAQISYRLPSAEMFGALRKGVTGHDGVVLDIGVDAVLTPADRTEFRVGPRMTLADEAYANTYFTVPTGATLPAYDASGGLHSYGVEMSVRHEFNDDWAVKGSLGWNRLAGSIGDSPVVQDRDSGMVSVVLYRSFDWRW